MKATCRLLLIEDDPKEADMIERQCCPDPSKVAFSVAANAADAEEQVRGEEFDLVICDLALPADARQGDPEVAEGQRLFGLIREQAPGTPVIILSAHGDLTMMHKFFGVAGTADLYGERSEHALVLFFEKEKLPECVEAVKAHIAKTEALDRFSLEGDNLGLGLSEERALKIYGRAQGAQRGVVSALDGGLSGTKTLKLELRDGAGDDLGRTVAKIGDLRRVLREANRLSQIAARIPVGLGAQLLEVVHAGTALRGALIYQFASEYTATLAGKLIAGEDAAAAAVTNALRQGLSTWTRDAPIVDKRLVDMRRPLVSDVALVAANVNIPDERPVEIRVREAMAHRDLHGFNVLVNDRDEPTLIDYGEVGKANAALDPVTLELSILFHPGIAEAFSDWPSEEQAKSWVDLDAYLVGCPVPEFVNAARRWAVEAAAGTDELIATAYSYALRQAKYQNPNTDLALAFTNGAHGTLVGD